MLPCYAVVVQERASNKCRVKFLHGMLHGTRYWLVGSIVSVYHMSFHWSRNPMACSRCGICTRENYWIKQICLDVIGGLLDQNSRECNGGCWSSWLKGPRTKVSLQNSTIYEASIRQTTWRVKGIDQEGHCLQLHRMR